MDEQFKNLRPDLDEIEARSYTPRNAYQPIDIGPAIVVGAIILVIGLWGGKIFYDHVQEMRAQAALTHLAKSLNTSMQQMDRQTQIATLKAKKQAEQRQRQQELENRAAEAKRQAQITQAAQERRLQTAECRFWWQQYANNPNARNEAKKMQSCKI